MSNHPLFRMEMMAENKEVTPMTPDTAKTKKSTEEDAIASGGKMLAAGKENRSKREGSLTDNAKRLLREIVVLTRKCEGLYDELANEIAPHCRTSRDYDTYFEMFIRSYVQSDECFSNEEFRMFYIRFPTEEENKIKRKLQKRVLRMKEQLRVTLFPHITEIEEYKKMEEKMEKSFAQLTLTNQQIDKRIAKEARQKKKKLVKSEKSNKPKLLNEKVKGLIRILMFKSVDPTFDALISSTNDDDTVNSAASFITAESRDIFISDFKKIVDVILGDTNENFSKYLIDTDSMTVIDKSTGNAVDENTGELIYEEEDDDDDEDEDSKDEDKL